MSIPGSASPLFIGAAAGAAAAYQIDRSLRFNQPDSPRLSRTPSSNGNKKTFTISAWVKKSRLAVSQFQNIVSAGKGSPNNQCNFHFDNAGRISFYNYPSGGVVTSSAQFRDFSAWYHCVASIDTTQSSSSNRVKIYVNNTQIDEFTSNSYPSQNQELFFNSTADQINVGANGAFNSHFFSGYIAEVHFIDGQALAPTDFGEYDSNSVWQPKEFDGTYGTNGFYLKFADSSSNAALGTDSSGNSNTFSVHNLSVASGAGNDSMIDTPTNYDDGTNVGGNYCTWNFLNKSTVITLSNGNLETSQTSTKGKVLGTIGVTSGKWYWEVTATSPGYGGSLVGIAKANSTLTNGVGEDANSWSYANNGNKYTNNTGSGYGYSYGSGDTIGVAFNADAGTLTFYKNGTSQGQAYSGLTSGPYFPAVGNDGYNYITNFGQRGSFIYTPPTGHLALCTTNLPDPTIADGSTAFDVALWTGNNSTQSLTGFNFSPDLFWSKSRSTTWNNGIHDIVRGTNKLLRADTTGAEYTASSPNESITSFNSDGVTFGADGAAATVNYSGTYVGWAWDAGTSTVSNTDGSITSSVRASQTNGISIVSYTGSSSAVTVGHGLNAAPEMIIVKDRDSGVYNWQVAHIGIGADDSILLNTTGAATDYNAWGNTRPTSTVFSLGAGTLGVNTPGNDMIAYCFAPVEGFSAFGSYEGNGSNNDAAFVYTGFKPRWIIIKNVDNYGSGYDWFIFDTERSKYNVTADILKANLSAGEYSFNSIDILSNGFKIRRNTNGINLNAHTHVWAAFAEHPFKTARAR